MVSNNTPLGKDGYDSSSVIFWLVLWDILISPLLSRFQDFSLDARVSYIHMPVVSSSMSNLME